MRHIRSTEDKKAAVELVREGKKIEAVAAHYKVHENTVRSWLKKGTRAAAALRVGAVIDRPVMIAKPNLARMREAIATLSEAGLI